MMRNILLYTLLFLFGAHASQAQCNPKEYTRIFTEATALQEQGAFIEAKNRYEAAIIYACSPKEKDAAEKRVDALFEQIDRLRLQAYANDLAFKSRIALKDGDRNAAFRLAEFAHRYVDNNNKAVREALINTVYYNDNPDTTHRLPRSYNIENYHCIPTNVTFSSDSKHVLLGLITNCSTLGKVSDDFFTPGESRRIVAWWNLENRHMEKTFDLGTYNGSGNLFQTAISSDGRWASEGLVNDDTIAILDLWEGHVKYYIHEEENTVNEIKFLPESDLMAIGLENNTVEILNFKTGVKIDSFGEYNNSLINKLAISTDGRQIAIAGDTVVNVWRLNNHELIKKIDIDNANRIDCISFSTDADSLAIALEGSVRIWDIQSDRFVRSVYTSTDDKSLTLKVAFSPDGRRLLTVDGNLFNASMKVKIWDIESGKIVVPIEDHSNMTIDASFSKNGRYLSTCTFDGTTKIWDLEFEKIGYQIPMEDYAQSIQFSPVCTNDPAGGRFLAIGCIDNTIKVWDNKKKQFVCQLKGHRFTITSMAFSPDGKRLASTALDRTAIIWDLEKGASIQTLNGLDANGTFISFLPDGKKLGIAFKDSTARIWDMASARFIKSIHTNGSVWGDMLSFHDGLRVTSASNNGRIEIWDPAQEKLVLSIIDSAQISVIACSPDGLYLAAGLGNSACKVWDVRTGKTINVLSGHTANVLSVKFSPDSRFLATGTSGGLFEYDKTAKIWDLESGKVLITIEGNDDNVHQAIFSPDGSQLATLSAGVVKLWELSGDGLIARWNATGPTAELSTPQLQQYNLETLLDQQPQNETALIATGEVGQILAFADLAASQASGSNVLARVEAPYARADRLYAAALALRDNPLVRQGHATLLRRWAAVYKSDGLDNKATDLEARADRLWKEK